VIDDLVQSVDQTICETWHFTVLNFRMNFHKFHTLFSRDYHHHKFSTIWVPNVLRMCMACTEWLQLWNSEMHSHNTRRKDDLFILPCNTSLCKNNFNNIGIRMLNQLPLSIKEIPVLYKFKRTLKAFLLDHCFYSIDKFLLFGAYPSSKKM
jgi:hypothetical protein